MIMIVQERVVPVGEEVVQIHQAGVTDAVIFGN